MKEKKKKNFKSFQIVQKQRCYKVIKLSKIPVGKILEGMCGPEVLSMSTPFVTQRD